MPPLPGTETILVVDDEHAILSIATLMLQRHGYNVITSPSGKETLHLFAVFPDLHVDLMLIDIIMPEMNGLELASRLSEIRPEAPVLFFSAYSERDELRPILTRKLPYISKPFTSVRLTHRIREILDGRAAAGGAE
jgi:two-component system, cell cycle sensor histidine kinase and response regulator CckA